MTTGKNNLFTYKEYDYGLKSTIYYDCKLQEPIGKFKKSKKFEAIRINIVSNIISFYEKVNDDGVVLPIQYIIVKESNEK